MPRPKTITQIPLPKNWSTQVKSAVLQVIALAQYALIYRRSWAANDSNLPPPPCVPGWVGRFRPSAPNQNI